MTFRELRREIGRLAIVGFAGRSVPDDTRRLAADFDLGGVIYFSRNIESPEQVRELSRESAGLAREWPLWVSVDQEGGRVARLTAPFTVWPPAASLGRSGDVALARRFAASLATELQAVGVNMDYAPVLDVHTNPANPIIGDRALSDRAEVVAELGVAIIETLQAAGITACGKHFPGHGDTSVDSHEALPVVEHERRRLEAVEWLPFRQAIRAGVATLMTAHVLVPSLDERRMATCSPIVVEGLLKGTCGFSGVVISDDLGMKAVSASMSLGDAAVAAIGAGCDAVLLCNSTVDEQVTALESLIRAAERGGIPLRRFEDALARQHGVKARLSRIHTRPLPDLALLGCGEHQRVASEMAAWL